MQRQRQRDRVRVRERVRERERERNNGVHDHLCHSQGQSTAKMETVGMILIAF